MSRRRLKPVRLGERGSDILRMPRRDAVAMIQSTVTATDLARRRKIRFIWLAAGTALVIGSSWVWVIVK